MIRLCFFTLLSGLLIAGCGDKDGDTAVAAVDSEPAGDGGDGGGSTCYELEIRYDGPDEPIVGDAWTIIPYCDGALVLGVVVIQVEPVECGLVDETLITFAQAGACEINVQAGSTRNSLTVEVGEAL